MKRSELEKYLGKRVTVTLFDGDVISGENIKPVRKRLKTILIFTFLKNIIFALIQ